MQIMLKCFQIVFLVVALAGLFVSSWASCSSANVGGEYAYECSSNPQVIAF